MSSVLGDLCGVSEHNPDDVIVMSWLCYLSLQMETTIFKQNSGIKNWGMKYVGI